MWPFFRVLPGPPQDVVEQHGADDRYGFTIRTLHLESILSGAGLAPRSALGRLRGTDSGCDEQSLRCPPAPRAVWEPSRAGALSPVTPAVGDSVRRAKQNRLHVGCDLGSLGAPLVLSDSLDRTGRGFMKKIHAVRRFQFAAGHRVHQHESKCKNLHGHNYVVHFHAEADEGLDALGRVIDFGVLKQRLGEWLEENWDHGFLLWKKDEEALEAVHRVRGQKLCTLDRNPTAENLALLLLHEVAPRVLEGTGVHVTRVVLWETENCYVEVQSDVG
ncbi:6-pyruvoyl trahydropterin synthase family protein [Cystobacter fuscus]